VVVCWLGSVKDGSADLVLGARERRVGPSYPWCPKGPYPFKPGRVEDVCDAFHFWSPHAGGANFLLADGSVRLLRYDADAVLPALAARANGEVASPD
jgi:prepilin-type processing-associated H-X9-DG protein